MAWATPPSPWVEVPGAPAPRELELTFGTEPVIGWRAWRVLRHGLHGGVVELRLASLGVGDYVWSPRRRVEAVCWPSPFGRLRISFLRAAGTFRLEEEQPDTHDSPAADCRCGTWALRSKEELLDHLRVSIHRPRPVPIVYGEVAMWGRIVEQERGWRAQYAYPRSLVAFDPRVADAVSELYAVPARVEAPPPPPPELESLDDPAAIKLRFSVPVPMLPPPPAGLDESARAWVRRWFERRIPGRL